MRGRTRRDRILDPPACSWELSVKHIEELTRHKRKIRRFVVEMGDDPGFGIGVDFPGSDRFARGIFGNDMGVR